MNLRQVALAAGQLAPVRAGIFDLLGVSADFADPGVGDFGLENTVMAIGDTFLEVVAPIQDDTAAGRWLERHGGNGGYMALFQVDDIEPHRQRIDKLQVRKVWDTDRDEVKAFHIHPRDIGAAIVSIDEMNPPEEWLWAGDGWRERQATRVRHISAIDVGAADPEGLADNWARVLGQAVKSQGDRWVMSMNRSRVNFVPAIDDRGDRIVAVEFETADTTLADTDVEVCGTTFRFVS